VRVTSNAEVFDGHTEGHAFLSLDRAFFEGLATPKPEDPSAPCENPGHCWLVEPGGDAGTCGVFVATSEGPISVLLLKIVGVLL
jgi:hypothetical protein